MGETDPAKIPVVILAGGRGARFDHESQVLPKPMIEVAGKPILVHIIESLAAQGFREFYVATGYLRDRVHEGLERQWPGAVSFNGHPDERFIGVMDWNGSVRCVNTGDDSHTGERIRRLGSYINGRRFVLTYGDGLSDVQMSDVLRKHDFKLSFPMRPEHNEPRVTLTAVNPPGRFGTLDLQKGLTVFGFKEKSADEWINGGFMICEPEVFDDMLPGCGETSGPEWEGVMLPEFARHWQLRAHRHTRYWRCMDTRRDLEQIETDVKDAGGKLPWRRDMMEATK